MRGEELVEALLAKRGPDGEMPQQAGAELAIIGDLCDVMEQASLCQMGGMTPIPVRSALGLK